MCLLQAKKDIWDEIIVDMKNHWEYITLMVVKKTIIKDYEFFILFAKEEGEKNAHMLRNSYSM